MSKPRQTKPESAPRTDEDTEFEDYYTNRFLSSDEKGNPIIPLGDNGEPITFLDENLRPVAPIRIIKKIVPRSSKSVLLIGRQSGRDELLWRVDLLTEGAIKKV